MSILHYIWQIHIEFGSQLVIMRWWRVLMLYQLRTIGLVVKSAADMLEHCSVFIVILAQTILCLSFPKVFLFSSPAFTLLCPLLSKRLKNRLKLYSWREVYFTHLFRDRSVIQTCLRKARTRNVATLINHWCLQVQQCAGVFPKVYSFKNPKARKLWQNPIILNLRV